MDVTARVPPPVAGAESRPRPAGASDSVRRSVLAWSGPVLYVLVWVVLLGGAPRASATVHVVGSLLALSLLVGVLRRAPLVALTLTLLGSLALLLGGQHTEQSRFAVFLGVDLTVGVILATRGRWQSLLAVSVTSLVQLAAVAGLVHGPNNMVGVSLIVVLSLATSCMVGLLGRQRRQHAGALRARAVAEAVTAERLRIARELHDMVAHSVGIIAIQAGVGSRVITSQPAEAGKALRAIETTSRETLAGLRRTLVALRQADHQQDTSSAPLVPAPGLTDLERLAASTAEAGVRVDLRVDGPRRALPPEIELSAYRIVQEALTNVVRHAGVSRCQVRVGYAPREVTVEVLDEGRGAPGDSPAGFGLTGMRERAALLHGELRAGARPGGGFGVTARLPLPESDQGGAVAG
jgi:signal transduction histidine kinase